MDKHINRSFSTHRFKIRHFNTLICQYVFVILIILMISSCKKDCSRTIKGIDLYGITTNKTDSLLFDNWYKADSFSQDLSLYVDLEVYGGGEFCNYYMQNKVIEDSIRICCNHRIVVNNDSISAFSDIKHFVDVIKRENKTYLDVGYFITLNKTNHFSFDSGNYMFYFNAKTTDGLVLIDSCKIKMK